MLRRLESFGFLKCEVIYILIYCCLYWDVKFLPLCEAVLAFCSYGLMVAVLAFLQRVNGYSQNHLMRQDKLRDKYFTKPAIGFEPTSFQPNSIHFSTPMLHATV